MNPKTMDKIAAEMLHYSQRLIDPRGMAEPSPRYVEGLSNAANSCEVQLRNIQEYAIDVVCRFVDDATGKALRLFPDACEAVAREILAGAQRKPPTHDLSMEEIAALRLADHVLQVTTEAELLIPREEVEDA